MICLGLRPFLPIEPFCLCSIYRTDRIIVFIPILRAKKVCLIPYSHCDSPFFLLFFTYKDLFEALFISLAEGPDVGTGEREMSWMKYTYKEYYGSKDINADGATTGKTLKLFGISGRTESTGLGVFSCTQQLLNGPAIAITLKIKHGLKGKTFVVQGFGNVGFWASKYFTEEGSKLIGVSELDGSIYNSKDIDCLALKEHIHHHKGVKGFPGANYYEKEDVIYKHCDIFIPAATQMSINRNNAHLFQCKLVVEAANGPTTVEGQKICLAKGIKFLPDVLCNAGGVAVSYFEWLKNLEHVSPGRMSRKWQQKTQSNLLDVINEVTELRIDKQQVLKGASQKDIVHAGIGSDDPSHKRSNKHLTIKKG